MTLLQQLFRFSWKTVVVSLTTVSVLSVGIAFVLQSTLVAQSTDNCVLLNGDYPRRMELPPGGR